MADKDGVEWDNLSATTDATNFSHLLFSDDGEFGLMDGVDGDYSFGFSSPHFLDKKPPKMLSFGNFQRKQLHLQKSGISCSDSSSSSGNDCDINALRLANAKRSGSGLDPGIFAVSPIVSKMPNQRTSKKIKSDNPNLTSHAKVSVERKEKLGERVATLQQLVSPFGKTDTSSVLHEAMGYIKFLHEQVEVLCCPYFQNLPFLSGNRGEEEEAKDTNLRSRGLCLVPVETTLNMANNNGADLWLPGMKKNSTKH